MYEGLGIVKSQGLVFSLVTSGRQVIGLTTTEQDGLDEPDTILTQEQHQRPAPFAICRTAHHKGSAIGQVACTLLGARIGDVGDLWFAPSYASVVAHGCKLAEGTLLVAKQHDDGSVRLHILAGFYLTRLLASGQMCSPGIMCEAPTMRPSGRVYGSCSRTPSIGCPSAILTG